MAITVPQDVTIFAEGVQSKLPITWGTKSAPVSGASSRHNGQFTNIYKEPIKVLAVNGTWYSTRSDGVFASGYQMLVELKPSRGYAWMKSSRPFFMFSDFTTLARLEFSYLKEGGLILQPQEGLLIELLSNMGLTMTHYVTLEAYMPRDPTKLDWHDERTLWSPLLQMGALVDLATKTRGYLPYHDPGATYQDSLSNETDRPILVRSLSLSLLPRAPSSGGTGFQTTIKIRRRGGRIYEVTAREILGGVSNYVSPALRSPGTTEWVQELFTLKRPYVMEPNETIQVTHGICTDTVGASGYETIPEEDAE